MEVSTEVVQSLRVLGLSSGATADDVRSAFRRLARVYHPDVAGKHYSRKFEHIAKAYALLKDSPLAEAPHAGDDAEAERERIRRAAENARKKVVLEREARVEGILKRGERFIDDFITRAERETRRVGIQGLALRLASDVCQVRHLALEHLGELTNSPEIFNAILGALQKWDIDEKTARLVSSLPLTPENHRRLAVGLASRAGAMPDSLLSYLLQLYNSGASGSNSEFLETYLAHAGGRGVALIMRRWPGKTFISESLLCRLISGEDESVLISTLSAMKQRSIPCPPAGRERLNAHLSHPNMAVRIWAKALLNSA